MLLAVIDLPNEMLNRTRVLSAALALPLAAVCFYAISRTVIDRSTSKSKDSFILTKCLDETGQVMGNDDGRLQYRCIDRKALLAKNADPEAVRELADAVVEFNGTAGAPQALLNQFEERLAQAELNYRAHNKSGIPSENIVQAANNLAKKVNAPDYAKTDIGEVKLLRDASRSEMPHFISPESRIMSPLEAAYLVHLLIYQKLLNETFLLTPTERTAIEQGKPESTATVQPNQLRPIVDPRVKEMLAVAHKAGSMRLNDLIVIGQEFLDDLGIDR